MAAASASASSRGAAKPLPKGLKVLGTGSGGVSEMAGKVDDSTVQFALADIVLGTGSFKRHKMVFVHIQGEKAGAVAKGRLNTLKGAVKDAFGSTHAEVQIYGADECTPEHFLETLSKVIKVDDMGGFSISKMKADYEAMIAAAGPSSVAGGDVLARAATRKTAAEMGTVEAGKALEAVKQTLGPFNWVLFKPSRKLELLNAGSMSVSEMTKWLADDQVAFGLLRMGFGVGKFRRIKWICLHWSGDRVSPVKRGQANAMKGEILGALEPFSLTISSSSAEDMTLEAVIAKVKATSVVDGADADSDEDPYSVESFMKALREEAAATAEFYGETGDAADAGEIPFGPALSAVHNEKDAANWLLVGKA